jgi:hypothetical protein
MPIGWKVNTIIFIFNVCDTIGRYLPNYITVGKRGYYFLVFSRFIFLITYPLAVFFDKYQIFGDTFVGIYCIINMIVFGLTNGIVSTLSFVLGITACRDELKATAGSSLSFTLICGIFTGTIFATVVMKNIINAI